MNTKDRALLINCDMGEWDAPHLDRVDDEIMPWVDLCNIACGSHAGNIEIMEKTLNLTQENNVKAGAHPGYEDRSGFGRSYISMRYDDLKNSISKQIEMFLDCCSKLAISPFHIKMHGALYHACNQKEMESDVLLEVMTALCPELYLLVAPESLLEQKAKTSGLKTLSESFIDRRYNDDLSLVSRKLEGAVIQDEDVAKSQFEHLKNGNVTTISGFERKLYSDTTCIHGDNPKCISILKTIRYGRGKV